jgi:hypothetical protein
VKTCSSNVSKSFAKVVSTSPRPKYNVKRGVGTSLPSCQKKSRRLRKTWPTPSKCHTVRGMCLWRHSKKYLKPLSHAETFKVGESCACSDSQHTYLHLYACIVEMMWVLKAGVHDVWIGYRAVESTGKPVDSSSKFAKWIWVDNSEASYTNLARQKCFKVFLEPKTWHQAQRACEQWERESGTVSSQDTYSNGRSGLASITSSEDARFLSELALDVAQKYDNQNTAKAHTMHQIYIGFNKRHTKDFVWSDGSGIVISCCGSLQLSHTR